jgi:cobalamin biosynthesis protein CobD/CbiB
MLESSGGIGPLWPVLQLLAAIAVDLACGESPARLHPVVWMGRFTDRLRRMAPREERAQLEPSFEPTTAIE